MAYVDALPQLRTEERCAHWLIDYLTHFVSRSHTKFFQTISKLVWFQGFFYGTTQWTNEKAFSAQKKVKRFLATPDSLAKIPPANPHPSETDPMNDFTTLVTLLATLSVAVERAVETLKQFVPYLNVVLPPGPTENRRRAVMSLIAVGFGTIAAYCAKDQLAGINAAKWLVAPDLHYIGYVIVGFLTAGGSAFWNHVLDILGALKTQKEKVASVAQPAPVAAPVPAVATATAAGSSTGAKP
jgi:hypothetical protein